MLHHVVIQAADLIQQKPPFLADGPDFSNITPDSKGVPKSGIFVTIGQVLLYGGLGMLFLALIAAVISWGAGSFFKNTTWSEDAKAKLAKVGLAAIALTAIGGIWTWITKL